MGEQIAYIWTKLEVAAASLNKLAIWVIKVTIQNLFRERKWTVEPKVTVRGKLILRLKLTFCERLLGLPRIHCN